MPSGTIGLVTGSDYLPGDEPELCEDIVAFMKLDKVGVAVHAPDFAFKKTADGGMPLASFEKLLEDRPAMLMVSLKHGFPAPFLGFYVPGSAKRTTPKAKTSKYARKA